jgi:predicted N-acyltransferase
LFSDNETLVRLGCQYHWFNDNYLTFDDFLSALSSKKRKNIKRERRKVSESGLEIECLSGDGITEEHWKNFYAFYCSTFYQKWGEPRLTLDFFLSLNSRLPDCAVLILAKDKEKYVAGAFALSSEDTLYGRHWGCNENYDSLHFELCYYQTIEYCIRHKLKTLDAGAQGEHKISRGFVPIKTWSLHWLRELSFRKPVENFLNNETEAIEEYINKLEDHSAFKKDVTL